MTRFLLIVKSQLFYWLALRLQVVPPVFSFQMVPLTVWQLRRTIWSHALMQKSNAIFHSIRLETVIADKSYQSAERLMRAISCNPGRRDPAF